MTIAASGSGRPTQDREAPTVVARSRSGEWHTLLHTGTDKQAVRVKQQLQRELDALGEPAYRAKYGLRLLPERRLE